MTRRFRVALIVIVCVLVPIAWCAAVLFSAPGSANYKPVSPWEQRVMAQSTRDIHPDAVRANLAAHRVQVAWAGILREVEFFGELARPMVRLTVEHHDFDWIEDWSLRREHYFLSPRSEGMFRYVWPLRPEWDMAAMRRMTVPGLMTVIYGTPERLDGATIDLGSAAYARLFPPGSFTVDPRIYDRGVPNPTTPTR